MVAEKWQEEAKSEFLISSLSQIAESRGLSVNAWLPDARTTRWMKSGT